MPSDSRDPSQSMDAILNRNAVNTATPNSHARARAARNLLEQMLNPKDASIQREAPFVMNKDTPAQIGNMMTWFMQRYPAAGAKVNELRALTNERDPKEENYGYFDPLFGEVAIREIYQGNARSPNALKGTIMHELSHGLNSPDYSESANIWTRPVTSYDVGHAARVAREDINLPLEQELLKRVKK